MVFTRRLIICLLQVMVSSCCLAQENKNVFEVYGSIFIDAGYDFRTIDPQWFDVMRPTKLPSYPDEFAPTVRSFIV